MDKRIIGDMIPLAMKACERWLIENGKQRNAIYGKVASLGVDVTQMGLLPAVMSFEDSRPAPGAGANQAEAKNGWRVNSAVFDIVAGYLAQNEQLLEKYNRATDSRQTSVWSIADAGNQQRALLKEALLTLYRKPRSWLIPVTKMLVLHACVALKMTLNTFEGVKDS